METQETTTATATAMALASTLDSVQLVARNLKDINFVEVVTSNDPKVLLAIENMERAVQALENRVKETKAQYAEVKQKILEAMELQDIKKVENDHFKMVAKSAYTRTQFDTTAFRNDHPDLAEPYIKTVDVKSSLEIKLK